VRFYGETLGLPDAAFSLLRDLILERTGLYHENGKRDLLADKLSPRVLELGFDSFLDYYYYLKYDDAHAEWVHLVDALSVQETYFWREMDQVRALADVLVPEHARPGHGPLRIWSAACATGEEPLTIAMALNEAGWFSRVPIEIYASDASGTAIQNARRGVYRERSFRSLPRALREKYFVHEDAGWLVAPELHARIRWARANLIDEDEIGLLAQAQFIFCRNVFIYFTTESIRRTVRTFWERTPTPAYLFLAAAESLLRVTSDWELCEIGDAFVYTKRGLQQNNVPH
jgi:chemotaxis protein methyltransferase CheR